MRVQRLIDTNYGTARGLVRLLLGQIEFAFGQLDRHLHPEPTQIKRLVFACLGNINRSAFAECVTRKRDLKDCLNALYTSTNVQVSRTALRNAIQFGKNLCEHVAAGLTDRQHQPDDLLLVIGEPAKPFFVRGVPEDEVTMCDGCMSSHRSHLHDPPTFSAASFQTSVTPTISVVDNLTVELRFCGSRCV